jgi:hypothetical protein
MTGRPIPNLHDAILERVAVDWRAGAAFVECGTALDARTILVVDNVREVRVDRREPWGPSESINSVYVDDAKDSEVALYIEMQSGDDIFIVGAALEVRDS